MKKLWVLVMFLCITVSAAGCAKAPEYDSIEYPWPVILIIKYSLASETTAPNAVSGLETYLKGVAEPFDMEVGIWHQSMSLQVQLYFYDYANFVAFNNLPNGKEDLEIINWKLHERLFYYDRTYTFNSPWKIMKDDRADGGMGMDKITAINFEVNSRGFTLDHASEVGYYYVFESTFRRSEVAGAYKVENNGLNYEYYFYGSGDDMVNEIKIFDQFANQPAWYITALIATVIFMSRMYITLWFISKNKKKVSCSQSKNDIK